MMSLAFTSVTATRNEKMQLGHHLVPLLQGDWWVSFAIMVINCMSVMNGIKKSSSILKLFWSSLTIGALPLISHGSFFNLIEGVIDWHKHHCVLWLFHTRDAEWCTILCPWECIIIWHLFFFKTLIDHVAVNVFWPLAAFFDHHWAKHAFYWSSMIPFNMQKPESIITMQAVLYIDFVRHNNKLTVLPNSSCLGIRSSHGWSLPSTSLRAKRTPLKAQ